MLRRLLTFFLFIAFCFANFLHTSCLFANEAWWNEKWMCRRKLSVPDASLASIPTDVAYFQFFDYGRLAPEARDVRIIDAKGSEVPSQIMFYNPDLYCIVAFRCLRGENTFYLYYDNKTAPRPFYSWKPMAGVFLTTYQKWGGGANNWKQMLRIFQNSRDYPLGAGYRQNIFDGFNPFGPSVDFVSHYVAWFRAPRDGKYRFCTASDDASFLFIDDRLVAEWPGWHDAYGGVYGQHSGNVDLKAGIHKLSYFHLQDGNQTACVAGWQPPGDEQISLMVRDCFVPVLLATCTRYEIRGEAIAPDFAIEQFDTLEFEGYKYVLYGFNDVTPLPAPDLAKRRWDFGDNISASDDNPSHIYLGAGRRIVRLNYIMKDGRTFSAEQPLWVQPNTYLTNADPFILQGRFVQWLKTYPLDALSDEDFLPAAVLLLSESRFEGLLKPLGDRVQKAGGISTPSDAEMFKLYARILAEKMSKPQDAETFLQKRLDMKLNDNTFMLTIPLRLYLARIEMEKLKNPKRAIETLQPILERESSLSDERQVELYTAMGDAYLASGDLRRARVFYENVEKLSIKEKNQPVDFYKSSYALTVESHLRAGKLKEAEDAIAEWRRKFPTEKLGGHSMLLEAKLLRAKKDYEASNGVLAAMMEYDPSSNLIREALFLQGTNLIALEKYADAAAIFRRILNQYDDPATRAELQAKLEYCEQQLTQPPPSQSK